MSCKLVLLDSVTCSSSSYIYVLYSYINLTILDFLHSVERAFFRILSFSFFLFLCVFWCFSFLAEKKKKRKENKNYYYFFSLILFSADVNWLPGSASPSGYSRQPVLQFLLLILSLS